MKRSSSGAPIAEHEQSRAIDRSVLREWLGGDDAAIDGMLLVFRESALTEHARMITFLAESDMRGYTRAAHRLRGAALAMGAYELADAVGALEAIEPASLGPEREARMMVLLTEMRRMAVEIPYPGTEPFAGPGQASTQS